MSCCSSHRPYGPPPSPPASRTGPERLAVSLLFPRPDTAPGAQRALSSRAERVNEGPSSPGRVLTSLHPLAHWVICPLDHGLLGGAVPGVTCTHPQQCPAHRTCLIGGERGVYRPPRRDPRGSVALLPLPVELGTKFHPLCLSGLSI